MRIYFKKDKTHQFLDLCRSFKKNNQTTDDKMAQFKELVNDPTVDIHAVTENRWAPLHFVCQFYSNDDLIDILRLLIQKRAYINIKTNDEETPLHLFCFNRLNEKRNFKNLDVVRFLIEKGADVNAKTKDGRTPLHCFLDDFPGEEINVDVVQFLIEKGADLNAKTNGRTNTISLLFKLRQKRYKCGHSPFFSWGNAPKSTPRRKTNEHEHLNFLWTTSLEEI